MSIFESHKQTINIPMIFRVIGILLIFEALFMCLPLIVALIYHESDTKIFGLTAAFTLVTGCLLGFVMKVDHRDMGKREGFLLTALVWVVFSFFGMAPFIFGSPQLCVSDAFFESMSGFTTTGASVLSDDVEISHAIHFWRSLMQWIGGMGIILFTLAVLPMLNSSGGMQMFNAEVTGITHDKLKPRVSQTAKRLWAVYTALTLALIFLLWFGPMDFFDSICHALSTISTGGFSTRSESISAWNSMYVKIVLTIFMFMGGINFALLYKGVTGHIRSLWENQAFKLYVFTTALVFCIFAVTLFINHNGNSFESLVIDPIFQVVSMMTSTGYTVIGFENWGVFLLMICIILMFFGACAGSTSGGAKLDRALVVLKNVRNEVYHVLHPNSVLSVKIGNRILSPEIVSKVLAFIILYGVVIIVGALLLTMINVPLVDSLFASFSCVSNAGVSAVVTGAGSTYEIFGTAGKWILSVLMLIGRLELFTVIVLFTPGFWRR
ncbi:MAG: TrkH family potassium uptake protein [Muribaculaceae bacterium]|nr:TrkH family potassium uptake protein [Muribaculaceae bacterium]